MKRFLPYIALILVVAEAALVLLSWLLSVAMPNSGVRSMLSGEGLRWFLGHFGNILATPQLAWLMLAVIAIGCFQRCGICSLFKTPHSPFRYRQRRAIFIAGSILLLCIIAMFLLTFIPHAVLISATGRLFPSPFAYSLVPVASFSLCLFSIVYGVIAGTFQTLHDIYDSLLDGIRRAAPLILFYILFIQLYASLRFVFG